MKIKIEDGNLVIKLPVKDIKALILDLFMDPNKEFVDFDDFMLEYAYALSDYLEDDHLFEALKEAFYWTEAEFGHLYIKDKK